MRGSAQRNKRASAAVAMVILLLIIDLIILGIVIGGARDHDLTIKRLQTIEAFYAAEAGMNMAVRELIEDSDEDLDGGVGTISNDGDDGNDPTFGNAQVVVTAAPNTPLARQTTLTSEGRSSNARRTMKMVLNETP